MQDIHPNKTLMMKLMLQEPIMNLNPAVIRATATSQSASSSWDGITAGYGYVLGVAVQRR